MPASSIYHDLIETVKVEVDRTIRDVNAGGD
jgi:hypothetical protein